ncbi:DUF488 domain-containing protein [Simulacricoccus sp. 17bor-14]|nr:MULTISPECIES: DUF488 domain-containing protein [Myxococcaceae]MBF5045045.1 DUF488 domain-containing protein [Simulacricoccus sp. 17bor-14]
MAARRRKCAHGWEGVRVYAVGHSTRSAEELIALLEAHGVRTLADIRTVPRSRTNPQFNLQPFARTLAAHDLGHLHLAELGGLRRPQPGSPNGAWRNRSFQGYADHMLTEEFARGLERLRELAQHGPVAVMCAEALRWRCHRSLLADALWARGVVVGHIESLTRVREHVPTAFARIRGLRVTYPATAIEQEAPVRRSSSSGRSMLPHARRRTRSAGRVAH